MDLSLLNKDISFDILSRLPVDTLVQTKYVSKRWQQLTSDPEFVQQQMLKAGPTSISGFFLQERYEYCDKDPEVTSYITTGTSEPKIHQNIFAFLPEKVTILASSNGLVCCRSSNSSLEPAIYICNPVNKQWITLKWEKPSSPHCIAFAFEPSSCSSFDAANGCKLVRISEVNDIRTHGQEEYYFIFDVFDFKKKSWVRSKEICYCDDALYDSKWIMTKGIAYWLTEGEQIIMFDVENELSLLVSLPMPLLKSANPSICLGESDGELHLVMLAKEALLVWALVDNFSSKWDLRSYIQLKLMEEENPNFLLNLVARTASSFLDLVPWMHPWAFKDGLMVLRVSAYACFFDISTRKLHRLCDTTELGTAFNFSPTCLAYSMSLASFASAYDYQAT